MTSPAELSHLKSEVAELWKRFKKEDPRSLQRDFDDPARKELVGQIKALDLQQKELLLKRDALRRQVEAERARTAGRRPLLRALGLVLGLVVGAAAAVAVAPALAELTVALVR